MLRILGLLTIFGLAAQSALAQESFYVVNQKPGLNTMTMDFSVGDSSFNGGHSELQSLGLEYRRAMDEKLSVWARTRLMSRRFSTLDQGSSAGVGLSDIELGLKQGEVYDLVTLIYGASMGLSPGATEDPRLGQIERSNNFSGTNSLAGYVGFESYSESLAVGGQAELRVYSDIRAVNGPDIDTITNNNRFVPRLSCFIETPVSRTLDLGFQAALARPDLSIEKYMFGGAGNQYEAGFYGHWKLDKETTALLQINAKNQKYPLSEDRVDLGVGLRRLL